MLCGIKWLLTIAAGLQFFVFLTYTCFGNTSYIPLREVGQACYAANTYCRVQLKEHVRTALGLTVEYQTGRVLYVDRGSDAYGCIFPGDKIVSEDGCTPDYFMRLHMEQGEPGGVVRIVLDGDRRDRWSAKEAVRRKPLSSFTLQFQHMMGGG